MLKITLEQWRMFRAVVEYGGFNQAAQQIFKSQSSIHNAVRKIESSLDVKLFTIEGRKTQLTEAGEMMLRRANYLLDEAEKVEAIGQTLSEGIETKLRIAIDAVLPPQLLYQALSKTSEQYPLLRVELQETVLRGAVELLDDDRVDMAISGFTHAAGFNEELCHIDFIAVAHPAHPLHQIERPLQLEDLKSHRQIVVRDSAQNNKQDSGWLGADQRWTVSHLRTSVDMISKGLGFAWVPVNAIEQQLEAGLVAPLNLGELSNRSATLYLNFKDGDRLGPAARTFIGELRYLLI